MVEGKRLRFSEENQRERYIGHLDSLEQVRISKDGDRKLARLLSDIYTGTMYVIMAKTLQSIRLKPVLKLEGTSYHQKG